LDKIVMKKSQQPQHKKMVLADSDSQAEIRRFNTLRQTGFSEKNIELIKEVQNIAPMDYLQSIKKQKKSYVNNQESWILKDLVEQSPLPNSVINILLHYVLIIKNMKVLKKNFIDPIAADWSELELKTPEQAIKHVRDLVNEAKEKKNQPQAYKRQNRQLIRKEKLPAWVDHPEEEVEDAQKQAAINERMKKYLQRKEGES
ncbi:MAG TPA: DnaD domain protein, partial [Tetragenococcus sp.]|nr:DnaD domain protein [Tetragenococcus sp.]